MTRPTREEFERRLFDNGRLNIELLADALYGGADEPATPADHRARLDAEERALRAEAELARYRGVVEAARTLEQSWEVMRHYTYEEIRLRDALDALRR